MEIRKDLIVIGGGSAGMAAAIQGALNGLSVVVFDASGIDFDKPCGEGLMPPAVSALSRLGVKIPEYQRFHGIDYVMNWGASVQATFEKGHAGIGVRRKVLRRAMWDRALELGVQMIERHVSNIEESSDYVQVEGIRATWLCLATGSRDPLLKRFGLNDARRKIERPQRIGLRRHANIKPWSDFVEVHWSANCELYVTPVGGECVNIAILSRTARSFDDALKLFPSVQQRLSGVSWDDRVGGVAPLAHRSSRLQKGRVFVAGDAAGFLDAMTGEGNSLALQSGMAVVESIRRNDPHRYRWLWIKIVWRYWIVTSLALRLNANEGTQRLALRMIARFPALLSWGVRFLGHVPS